MTADNLSREDRTAAYKIVYDEAIRALNLQRSGIDGLRARVGLLVSAATIATSFLGGLALQDHKGDTGSWIAIALFVAFGAVSLRILWPRAEGAEGFTATPSLVIAEYLERDDDEPAQEPWVMFRDLALYAEEAHDHNRDHHHVPLNRYFRAAIVLLTAEIASWALDLALR